jgi:hypothetical protein
MGLNLPEKEIIDSYTSGISIGKLALKYKTTDNTIKRCLTRNCIKLREHTYSFDNSLFEEIDTQEKAYWLGFIASDGCIFRNTIKIGLAIKDISHLEKFRLFMRSTHPIHTYSQKSHGKIHESCEICIGSKKVVNDLEKLNVGRMKSKTLMPPLIEDGYVNSYLRGIIDGDGCFSIVNKKQLRLSIISSLQMCEFIMNTFVEKCGVIRTKIITEKRSDDMYYCYFGGNEKTKRIANYLYTSATVFLERKYQLVYTHLSAHKSRSGSEINFAHP